MQKSVYSCFFSRTNIPEGEFNFLIIERQYSGGGRSRLHRKGSREVSKEFAFAYIRPADHHQSKLVIRVFFGTRSWNPRWSCSVLISFRWFVLAVNPMSKFLFFKVGFRRRWFGGRCSFWRQSWARKRLFYRCYGNNGIVDCIRTSLRL